MTHTDKLNLIAAYEAAWLTINDTNHIMVDIAPNGWFEINILINSTKLKKRVRAADLLSDLSKFTQRIKKDMAQQVAA
jgi:hypothetical protein